MGKGKRKREANKPDRSKVVASITKQMLDARDFCRRLPQWHDIIPGMKKLILKRAELEKCTNIHAVHELVKLSEDDPITVAWILAAYVELSADTADEVQADHQPNTSDLN